MTTTLTGHALDVALRHEATRVLDEAEARLRRWDTPLETALLAVTDRRLTDEVPTMAVRLRSDGVARLLANPAFVCDVGPDGAAFVLCHEAMHLLFNHLWVSGGRDAAWTLACEVVINHWVRLHTGQPLPRSGDSGDLVGIDPWTVYQQYRRAAREPVTYDDFVLTDEQCAAYLRQAHLETPEETVCGHGGDGPDGEREEGDDVAVEKVLEDAVRQALDGDRRTRRHLLDLADAHPDARVWDRIGVSELRATTTRLGSTRLWESQLANVLGRLLQPDLQQRYDRKVGWWDAPLLAAVGLDLDPDVGMPLLPVPTPTRRRRVAIYIDTSASVTGRTLEAIASTVGRIADTDVDWHTFDHEVHPFEPGEPLVGGGGTAYAPIVDDLDVDDAFPDAVLVLTDGWSDPIAPPHPHRWIWIVFEHGHLWPRDCGMRTVVVPTPGE